jgi:carbamoyl-phosphate synthase large subunit
MRVLVTGAGSLIGHGILRCLRLLSGLDLQIFTADPDHRAAGHWLGAFAVTIPLAKDVRYMDSLQETIQKHEIDVLFIGTDPELIRIAENVSTLKCATVISSPDVIRIGEDKWETVNFLRTHGFPYPDSALSSNAEAVKALVSRAGFPMIAKPRIGARSVGVRMIQSQTQLDALSDAGYILQEHLPEEAGEFTAGTMTYGGKCASQVIFRRDLKDGNTYRAYTFSDAHHEDYLRQVSEAMPGVYGPLNFQYRLREGKPVVFEINSRFSGTTPLRAAVGLNEVGLALEFIRTGKIVPQPILKKQVAILRTWSDVIVPIDQIASFKDSGYLDSPKGEYFPFMR